jgi:hypothetical protein
LQIKILETPELYVGKQNSTLYFACSSRPRNFFRKAFANFPSIHGEQNFFATLRNTKLFKDHEIAIKINAILSMVFNYQKYGIIGELCDILPKFAKTSVSSCHGASQHLSEASSNISVI